MPQHSINGIRLTYDYVKSFIEKEGYVLLSDTYKNVNEKLKIQCPMGHIFLVSFTGFRRGKGCLICSKNKYTYDYVKSFIEKEGYQLLSDTYKNVNEKLKIQCPMGHIYKTKFTLFKNGNHRCSKCNNGIKYTYKYVKSFIKKEGYQLLSNKYINSKQMLLLKCPYNHEYKVKFNNFQQGQRCPICDIKSKTSKIEQYIQNFVELLGYDIIRNDRSQIINPLTNKNLELDIWIPNLNKAIEYNGTYWHSLNGKEKRDQIKRDQCKQKDIDLLVIKENKWLLDESIELKLIEKWLKE